MNLRRCFRCFRKIQDPHMNSDGTYTIECENCKKEGFTIGIYNRPLNELLTMWNSLTSEEGFLLDSEDPKKIISSISKSDDVIENISSFIINGKRIEIDTDHDSVIRELLKEQYNINENDFHLNGYEKIMRDIDLCKISLHCGICDVSFNINTLSRKSKLSVIDLFQTNAFYANIKKICFLIFHESDFEIKYFEDVSDSILFLSNMT